jgi:hypothetical protein
MFEAVEIGHTIHRETYSREAPMLREAPLQAQKQLAGANFSVVVLVGSVEGAGRVSPGGAVSHGIATTSR